MAVSKVATVWIVTGASQVIPGPVQIEAIQNSATTSFAISNGTTTFLTGGSGTGQIENIPFRSAKSITVTVVGGGEIRLFERLDTNK